eukprot:3488316-Lingulodinium_polyedra.AAC.1
MEWDCASLPTEAIVQGLLHVDDSLVLSKVLCHSCLSKGMSKLWPPDIGISIESTPPSLVFLHVSITLLDKIEPCPIVFAPSTPNAAYAKGEEDFPAVSKLPPYIHTITCPKTVITPYLACKFATYNQVYGFDLKGAAQTTAILL